jgi:hypothetical protein
MTLTVSQDLQQEAQHWLEFLLPVVGALFLLLHDSVMPATMRDSTMKWNMTVVCDDARRVLQLQLKKHLLISNDCSENLVCGFKA